MITLKNKNACAVINEKGAELKSFISQSGREIMWCSDPKFWGKSSPVLFPMVGFLRDEKTVINGREYAISKHGFARDMVFEAIKTSDNSATFSIKSNEETLKHFPFEFYFALNYTLFEDRLEILYEVKNFSKTDMPFCIGAHPAIACENVDNCKLVFEHKETVNSPVINAENNLFDGVNRVKRLENEDTLPLNYDMFDNDCVYFDTIKSRSVSLIDGSNKGVKVSWEDFTSLGVWTPAKVRAPFICIEPWCGCNDYESDNGVFADKKDIETAKPNETKYYTMTIEEII